MLRNVFINFIVATGDEGEMVIIVTINGEEEDRIPLSKLEQVIHAIATAHEGIEYVDIEMTFLTRQFKKDEIIAAMENLKLKVSVIKNKYHLTRVYMCIYFYTHIKKYDKKRIAQLLGFPNERTIKTALEHRLELFNVENFEDFAEEFEDEYNDLTEETVTNWAALIKEMPKVKGASYLSGETL